MYNNIANPHPQKMSQLSFLIQNQKQVIVDKNYLQKHGNQDNKGQSNQTRAPPQVMSSGNIMINPNYVPNWKSTSSPRSYHLPNNISSVRSENSDTSEEMFKISMRVNALDQNQRRLESRFAKEFGNLHKIISERKGEYGDLMSEIHSIQNQINQSKKVIGHVLNEITSKK